MVSCIFTCTDDLDAEFPAVAARDLGLDGVPLLCTREIDVPGRAAAGDPGAAPLLRRARTPSPARLPARGAQRCARPRRAPSDGLEFNRPRCADDPGLPGRRHLRLRRRARSKLASNESPFPPHPAGGRGGRGASCATLNRYPDPDKAALRRRARRPLRRAAGARSRSATAPARSCSPPPRRCSSPAPRSSTPGPRSRCTRTWRR